MTALCSDAQQGISLKQLTRRAQHIAAGSWQRLKVIAHGMEFPDERIAAGKLPAGRLVLACRHTPTELVLSIRDDGRGAD